MKLSALVFLFIGFFTLNAAEVRLSDEELKKMIGHLLIVGFDGQSIDKDTKIVKQIQKYELGGVILFDKEFNDRTKTKNISSKEQLQQLTSSLKSFAKKPLLICVDQEGGKVARLKPAYEFDATPSAKVVSEMDGYMSKHIYNSLANTLSSSGINCNFAPVLDLALNEKNSVIQGLNRSYGSDPKEVVRYATIAIEAMKEKQILAVAKHFPGHGSSSDDSHKGFVDVTNSWSEIELEPYRELIEQNSLAMIMSAHVFNAKIDKEYPATLSYNTNTKLLRQQLGFDGVLVSDDMQMGAISKHYMLKQSVTLAINSGIDMLLFGNQLSTQDIDELVEVIYTQVKNGEISYARIAESNERVASLLKQAR